ncbi:unnamed protein product, partial [Ectocarpus sp. 12 AP-2014]
DEGGGRYGDDSVARADRRRRPRLVTLVDLEKQQGQQERLQEDGNDFDDSLIPPPLELAYRDADYDTDPGIAITRPRAVGGTA